MMRTLTALLLALPALAHACSYGLHLGTYHIGNSYNEQPDGTQDKKHLRGFNPGAWANCNGYTAGAYVNSIDRPTSYAGYTVKLGMVDVTAGVATGYGKPLPILVPSVALPYGLRIAAFPALKRHSGGIHFMWEF